MKFKKKIQELIENSINRIPISKFRNNLLVLFGIYVTLILCCLIFLDYFHQINMSEYKRMVEIESTKQKVEYVAAGIDDAMDEKSIINEITRGNVLNAGLIMLINKNGRIIYSNDEHYLTVEPSPGLLNKINSISGVINEFELRNKRYFVFFDRTSGKKNTLVYFLPVKIFEKYKFNFIEFIIVSSISFLILNIVIILMFRHKIYNPIVNVERIIGGLVEGEMDMKLDSVHENSPFYPLFSDLRMMTERLKDLILKEYTAKMMKKQAELDALQSQINPHFLYNTLESIRGQAMVEGVEEIEIMTSALSELFRYSISKKGNLVTLEEELANVENYLMIQQYRFNNKFIIINKVEADTLNCKVPKLLIQPIVENAILHGLETKKGKGTITISAYKTERRLVLNIEDDGLGISSNRLVKLNDILKGEQSAIENDEVGLKIGLNNVNQRIKLNFGNDYGLSVYSTKGAGTNVEVVLPQ